MRRGVSDLHIVIQKIYYYSETIVRFCFSLPSYPHFSVRATYSEGLFLNTEM
jgi:hypothetical protein